MRSEPLVSRQSYADPCDAISMKHIDTGGSLVSDSAIALVVLRCYLCIGGLDVSGIKCMVSGGFVASFFSLNQLRLHFCSGQRLAGFCERNSGNCECSGDENGCEFHDLPPGIVFRKHLCLRSSEPSVSKTVFRVNQQMDKGLLSAEG
ncbi:hypothetical protein BG60_35775 [Caballeronia zhejiangensis]|uniref:Uncharacterized protein n=1 Tax=Caballeronia zhejiangensis TaxID=871203 RepID=A0A656QD50_9BURK|nr:hypothetical protein BG58_41765 [Caballeronia jiangsuensis]KDR24695.1 hypothetical protein BG60_35775 [Caballeronia zhejiangensis]KWU19253.1 hypothetical protein AS149_13540 [Burkholderia cenocepacia]